MWVDDLSDVELLARTLEAEAGNQGFDGMLAVASVIRNRAGSADNIRATILKPGQFSAWNSFTGYAGGAQGRNMKTIEPSDNAYMAANSALGIGFEDPTGGATHYYNPDLANPSWGAQGGGNWSRIGDHVFGVPEGETVNNPIGEFGMVDLNQKRTNRRFTPTSNQIAQGSPNIMSIPSGANTSTAPQSGMMGQGFGQRLMGGLADPRTRQMLGTLSRTQFGKRIADLATKELGNNATAEYLDRQPGGKPFADAIRSGALTGEQAYTQWNAQANKKRNVREVNGNLIDVDTGEIIYGDNIKSQLTEEQFQTLKTINADLVKRTKEFGEIRDGFLRIKDLYDNPSGVNDYGLAVAFAKILDPGSVAREGEVRAVSAAGSPFYAFAAQARNFFSGQGTLPAKVRNEIMNSANISYGRYKKIAQDAVADAERLAKATGVPVEFLYKVPMPDVEMIIQSIPLDGNENEEPVIEEAPSDLPPIPKGLEKKFRQKKQIDQDDPLSEADQQELLQYWIKMWNRWPPEKKDEYLLNPEN
tara:strand:+ start:7342 stop:8934 length:1593 start_codon:yes stop_codon:yes gene_type:complete